MIVFFVALAVLCFVVGELLVCLCAVFVDMFAFGLLLASFMCCVC